MPKKGEYDKFNNFEWKKKSPFMIDADFESIPLPEDNVKKIQASLKLANIKNILPVVMVIN